MNRFTYIFSLVLLAFSLLANLYFYTQLSNTDANITQLEDAKQVVSGDYDLLKRDLDIAIANLKALKHPDNKPIVLQGSGNFTNARATVFWNSSTKAVYIDAVQLPAPPADKQYQVWAITSGKYKSLGVFNRQPDKDVLYRLENIEKPDAFAVSLALPQGDKEPGEICAMGKVAF